MERKNPKVTVRSAREMPKRTRPQGKPFVKGDPRINRKGRGRVKDYATQMNEAILKLANEMGVTFEEMKMRIYLKGATKAAKGEYNFFKDMMDRYHGKAPEKVDITTKGEPITSNKFDEAKTDDLIRQLNKIEEAVGRDKGGNHKKNAR